MKTYKIIAREERTSASGTPFNDEDLKVFDGYIEEYVNVDDKSEISEIVEEFFQKHNLNAFWRITIEEVN